MKKLYMTVSNYMRYDTFMIPVNRKDKTWKSILGDIERVLDEKFLDNEGKLEGIDLEIKFEMANPSDNEMIDEY